MLFLINLLYLVVHITGKSSLFSGAYNCLYGKPSLFSGAYGDLSGKPDLTVYATTTALGSKENALTFSAPLTRTTNTISLDLSSYLTSSTASTIYATITNLNTKENALTFLAPLTRTTNTIS